MANVLGVKYLKISKTDANGDDRSEVLRQLTNIRLKYSDIGVKQYNIQTIQELPTYFLFGINYQDIASPNDRGIYNYQTEASQAAGYISITSTDGLYPVEGYVSTIDNLRFDVSTGVLRLGPKSIEHNPNAIIQVTASVNYTPNPPTATPNPQLSIAAISDDGLSLTSLLSITSASVTSPGTLILTASITDQSPLWDQLVTNRKGLQLAVANSSTTNAVDFSNITLTITQSQAFTNTSSILAVPSPNNIKKFDSTDCDVTYGFVDLYPLSQYYMEVSYTPGISVPVNQQIIISGTALHAPVKDYYYNLQSQILPRYVGSRVSQLRLNRYTGFDSSITLNGNPYTGDTGYGKSPNVESNRAYFAWFTEVYGASPEYNDAVNVNIKYLVDELGNTYSPGLTRYFANELVGTFSQGETTELNFVDAVGGTNSTPTAIKTALNGQQVIIRPAAKASAVLYSQTGSSANAYTQSLQFTTIENGSAYKALTDFRFSAQRFAIGNYLPGTTTKITFPQLNWDFANGFSIATSTYTFNQTPQSKMQIIVKIQGMHLTEIYSDQSIKSVDIEIYKNGAVWRSYTRVLPSNGDQLTFQEVTGWEQFQSGDTIEVKINNNQTDQQVDIEGPVEILTAQQQLTQLALPTVSAPFFFTSSANPYILTASLQFSSSINQVYQATITSSGFDPARYKVSFQPGDQFRFENSELNVYTINKIISSSTDQGSNGQTVMLLDQPITNGTNVDYFLLRRFAPDPSNVIIQGIKPSGGTGAGTLKPLYITDNLNNNMASVVSKLSSENAI